MQHFCLVKMKTGNNKIIKIYLFKDLNLIYCEIGEVVINWLNILCEHEVPIMSMPFIG